MSTQDARKSSKTIEARTFIGRETTKTGEPRASQLEDFIRRANELKIGTEEPGSNGENWEVMDGEQVKKVAQDAEDDEEWVVVEAEM
jgi:hypothetical protein